MSRARLTPLAWLAMALVACGGPTKTTVTSEGPTGSSSSSDATVDPSETTTTAPTTTTSASSSTSTQGSSSSTTMGGCPFVCEPDVPEPPPYCDPFAQDCREGQKCVWYDMDGDNAWDATKCVDVTGNGQHGDPCTIEGGPASGIDDCAEGLLCWNVDEDGNGSCVAHCHGAADNPMCDIPCTTCAISRTLGLCLPGCNPLESDCSDSDVCIPNPMGTGFACVLDASGDMNPVGSPCEFANVCNKGTMCASTDAFPHPDCEGALGCCAIFCDLEEGEGDQNPTCQALEGDVPGVECVPVLEVEPDECTGAIGVCVIPEAP